MSPPLSVSPPLASRRAPRGDDARPILARRLTLAARRGSRSRRGLELPARLALGLLCSALGCAALGCGAKTGIPAPDPGNRDPDGSVDAGVDAAPDASLPCVELPLEGGPLEVSLSIEAEVGRADVLFLIDTTASMLDEIDQVRGRLRDRLAPAIREAIPDSRLGVATFADFPVDGYGLRGQDLPFELLLPMTEDVSMVQAAVDSIDLGNGMDEPESQIEALYQVASGEGIGAWVAPSVGCPGGGTGYPCFRTDALPVILLFTDARMHNGPGGSNRYEGVSPPPHTYAEAIGVLDRLGARVIGFDSGGAAVDLRQVARDTRTLDADGRPLVFEIGAGGEGLSTSVVDAIRTFASSLVVDIDAMARDPEPFDGVDVLAFVESIRPLEAIPADGIAGIDVAAGAFRGVVAGTQVYFEILLRPGIVVPGPTAQRFRLEIIFRGDGRTHLGSRLLEIVVPGADGSGCETR